MVLSGDEVEQDVLAARVICPVDLSPRHVDFACTTFPECMLPEEQHEAGTILI